MKARGAIAGGLGLAAAALVPAAAGGARAANLVEGGYLLGLTEPDAAAAEPGGDGRRLELGPDLDLLFTPRSAFDRRAGEGGDGEPPSRMTLRLSLSDGAAEGARLGRLGAGLEPPPADLATAAALAAAAGPSRAGGLAVGGAFEVLDLSLGGSLYLEASPAGETRVVGADLGLGRLGARLAFGQTEAGGAAPAAAGEREFYLFSTNLAARPWLSLEGDVGYAPAQAAEPPSTVGRVGVKLRF